MKYHVFISYRRSDASASSRLISEHLKHRFGRRSVFLDVNSIDLGDDFLDEIEKALRSSKIFLLLIGKSWQNSDNAKDKRLFDPEDVLRQEILMAEKYKLRIIPVLIDGARMPAPDEIPDKLSFLPRRNAFSIRHDSFDSDIERLIQNIGPRKKKTRYLLLGSGLGLLLAGLIVYGMLSNWPFAPPSTPESMEDSSSTTIEDTDSTILRIEKDTANQVRAPIPSQEPATATPDENFDAGYNYLHGIDVEQNLTLARDYFKLAANQGHIEAQYSMGLFYLYGHGGIEDRDIAKSWLRKAVEQGHLKSMVLLADLYGEENNCEEATYLFRRAAALGDSVAVQTLSDMQNEGICMDN